MAALGVYTDKGTVKEVDQDACCFLEAQTAAGPAQLAVMCDGVGGLAKGELASATVIQRLASWFAADLPVAISQAGGDVARVLAAVPGSWASLLQAANDDIHRYGNRCETVLGTTFTGMLMLGGRYVIGHVGDCRAYEVTHDACVQLTQDQTLVAQQVAEGLLTPEQAAVHPKRNVIMQSVGTQDELEPVFLAGQANAAAVYVLCCDGLYGKLAPQEMHATFRPGQFAGETQLQQRCAEAVQTVIARGEKDNVTVLAFSRALAGAVESAPADAFAASAALQQPGVASYGLQDEPESPTVVVDVDESPTVIAPGIRGGDAQ